MLRPRTALHAYQHESVAFLKAARSRLLIAGMGTGKTATALHAAVDLKRDGGLQGPILVCAPLLVASTVWDVEAALWQETRELRITLMLGTVKQRLAQLDHIGDTDILVTTYGLSTWLLEQAKQRDLRFGLVIADEASALKSPDAARTRALIAFAERAGRRWALTGTPRGGSLIDVWGPSQFATRNVAFPDFFTWRNAGFVPIDQYGRQYAPRHGTEAAVVERMRIFTSVVDRAVTVASRPSVTEIRHRVLLPAAAMELYNATDNGTTRNLTAMVAQGITPPHEMAVVGRLQQILSGAVYQLDANDGPPPWRAIHDARLDALQALHDGHDKPTLVYFEFRHELARICARFPTAVELTPDRVAAFNAGAIDMLLAHPQAAAHGINLQAGTDTIVFFTLGWSAERYEQAIARVARQGQRNPVSVYILTTPDTIDEVAWATVHRRMRDQDRTVASLEQRRVG